MGGKHQPSPPAAPDVGNLIHQQSLANNTNQQTPFGSNTYSQVMGADGQPTGQWNQQIQLNPNMQRQLDATQMGGAAASQGGLFSLGQALQNYSSPYTGSGLPQWQTNAQGGNPFSTGQGQFQMHDSFANPGQAQQGISTAGVNAANPQNVNANQFDINGYYNKVYDPMAATVNKQFDRDQQHQDAQLAAQGIPLGSEAYKESQNILGENRNDALTKASSAAYGQAQGASQNAFGQQLGAAQNNFGQSLSANQNQFGQNAAQAGMFNQGLGQNYSQNLGGAVFGNQAQQQQFGQNLAGSGQQFGQNMANAQLNNSVIPQQMQQQMALRNLPMAEAQGLFGLNPMQSPNFNSAGPANVLGAYGLNQQALQNIYNQQMANSGANNAGKFGLAGAGLGALGSAFGG